MSVLLETSLGDIVIDLFTQDCPVATKNFLKLCKIKYYNNCLFHNIQKDFLVQTGDPTNTGKGGESIYGILFGEQAKYFDDEIKPHLKHKKAGMVGMASNGQNMNGSQFYITTASNLNQLDEKHTLFGEVAEGLDVVLKINDAYCDSEGKPLQVIRIRHVIILDDPFDDPAGLEVPDRSPLPPKDQWADLLDEEEFEKIGKPDERSAEEIEEELKAKEAKSREQVLEIIGDVPDADAKPPDNVLFVCKLHPVTRDEDLEMIFSRFGPIKKCEIIKDWKTGESLCYAFIEFENAKDCEEAYFKMDNVLIDDRRIHVDFSQSVSKQWISSDGRMMRGGANFLGRKPSAHSEGTNKKDNKSSSHDNLELKKRGFDHHHNSKYQMVFHDDHHSSSSSSSKKKRHRDDDHDKKSSRDRDDRDHYRRRDDDNHHKSRHSRDHDSSRSRRS